MILIYDGDCGFCTNTAEFFRKRLPSNVEVFSWQSINDLSLYGLTESEVQKRAYFVDENDLVSGGAEALARCALHIPGWSIGGQIILLPGILQLAEIIYRFVAHNRHLIPGATKACEIPDTK